MAAVLLSPLAAQALPQGGGFVGGSGSIVTGATSQQVTQTTNRGVVNWNSFNVGSGESVNFTQPSAKAITLNRVTADVNPSQILGRVSANGNVIIANPNGVVFGAGSRVDVAGLIATTADTNTDAFMNGGRMNFNKAGSNAGRIEVQNGAQITTNTDSGLVALVAPEVVNDGAIVASKGNVVLAGAKTAAYDLYGDGLVSFAGGSGDGSVRHTGSIVAQDGTVLLTANQAQTVVSSVVNTDGITEASSISDGKLVAKSTVAAPDQSTPPAPAPSVFVSGSINADGSGSNKGGTIDIKGSDVQIASSAHLSAQGGSGVPVPPPATIPSDNDSSTGGNDTASGGIQLASLEPAAGPVSPATGNGGVINVIGSKSASIDSGALLSADGHDGGAIEFSAPNVILSGNMSAKADGGKAGTITIDPTTLVINNGAADGQVNHVSEQSIESLSQGGTNVSLVADNAITMQDLSDNELTGGTGNITLATIGSAGSISFDAQGDRIRTTSGNVTLSAGDGGIDIGSIRTGLDTLSGLTLGQPTGDLQAGSIRLKTTNGNVSVLDLGALGTSGLTKVDVESGGTFDARSISVKIVDLPDPGGNGQAIIDLDSHKDMTIRNGMEANARDIEGRTQKSYAHIEANSHTGDLTIGGETLAYSRGGIASPGDTAGRSEASIFLGGNTVDAQHVEANAGGGDKSYAGVTVQAATQFNSTYDVLALANKGTGGSSEVGNILINAPVTNVSVPDQIGVFKATTNVTVNGAINVATPEDAILNGPLTYEVLKSNRIFRLRGGNSVTVTGDIDSPLANLTVDAGKGGITLADITTGDAAKVDSLSTYQGGGVGDRFGGFQAGSVTMNTTKGGDITTGDWKTDSTFGTVTFTANSSGNLSTGTIAARIDDRPDRGSEDLLQVALNAVGNLLVGGDLTALGMDRQGPTQTADVRVALNGGNTLTVTGAVNVDAEAGILGRNAKDNGYSNAVATFKGGNAIDLGNVTVTANGGPTATSFLDVNAPVGTVSIGDLVAQATTTRPNTTAAVTPASATTIGSPAFQPGVTLVPTDSSVAAPAPGHAIATLRIVANGTQDDRYPADITYKGADPLSIANDASRQGIYTDSQTVGGDTARLIIVGQGTPPVVPPVTPPVTPPGGGGGNPGNPGTPGGNTGTPGGNTGTPGVTTPTPGATTAGVTGGTPLGQIELDRTSTFPTALYSYFGETTGDIYYFGNTDVNLTLLGNPASSVSASLANLAPAAGPGATGDDTKKTTKIASNIRTGGIVGPGTHASPAYDTDTTGPITRKVGGSDAKRARYVWPKFTGQASAEDIGNTALADNAAPAGTGPVATGTNLANLAPAAGGGAASLAQLDPAAGGGGNCGNNFLDDGYSPNFNARGCRTQGYDQ